MTSLGIRLPVVIQSQIDPNYRVANPAHLKRMIELGMAQPLASSTEGGSSASMGSSGGKSKGASMGMGMGMSGPGGPGGEMGSGGPGSSAPAGQPTGKPVLDAEGKLIPASFAAPRCDFVVQFAWQPRFDPEGGEKAGGLLPKPPETRNRPRV